MEIKYATYGGDVYGDLDESHGLMVVNSNHLASVLVPQNLRLSFRSLCDLMLQSGLKETSEIEPPKLSLRAWGIALLKRQNL